MIEKIKNAVTVDAVHTHTHTQCNLIENKEGMKSALLNIYARDG